jgi:hypothetical protein
MTATLIGSGLIAGVDRKDNPAKKRDNSQLLLSVAQLLKLLKVLLADSGQTDSYLNGKFRTRSHILSTVVHAALNCPTAGISQFTMHDACCILEYSEVTSQCKNM